jgi:hypothetical protein
MINVKGIRKKECFLQPKKRDIQDLPPQPGLRIPTPQRRVPQPGRDFPFPYIPFVPLPSLPPMSKIVYFPPEEYPIRG